MRRVTRRFGLLFAMVLATSCNPRPASFPPPAAFAVVGYGDSLTAGPTRTENYLADLPSEWSTMNKGASGEFGIDGAVRILGDIPKLIRNGVDVVVLMWGTNDVYSPIYEEMGPTWWRDELVTRLDQAVDVLQAAGIGVVLALPPPNVDPSDAGVLANERLQELLPILSEEMAQRGVPFVDIFGAVLAAPDPMSLFEADGVHVTEAGDELVAAQIAPAVQSFYDAWSAQAQP